jgi:hypothetical protein
MRFIPCVVAAALLFSAGTADAQFGVELRGGAAIGNHATALAGLETLPGPSLSAQIDYGVHPRAAIYAAYTYGSFDCQNGFCEGQTVKMTSSGFGGGVRVTPYGPVWARLGLLYHGTTVDAESGVFPVDPTLGYDLGAGIQIPAYRGIQFVTGLGYRSHPGSDSRTTVLTGEVGLRYVIGAP